MKHRIEKLRKKEPFEECPGFELCGMNACPLDSNYQERTGDHEDPDAKCRAQRPTRTEISGKFPGLLSYGGLSVKEYNREQRREKRTPKQVEADRVRMAEMRSQRTRDIPLEREKRVKTKASSMDGL